MQFLLQNGSNLASQGLKLYVIGSTLSADLYKSTEECIRLPLIYLWSPKKFCGRSGTVANPAHILGQKPDFGTVGGGLRVSSDSENGQGLNIGPIVFNDAITCHCMLYIGYKLPG